MSSAGPWGKGDSQEIKTLLPTQSASSLFSRPPQSPPVSPVARSHRRKQTGSNPASHGGSDGPKPQAASKQSKQQQQQAVDAPAVFVRKTPAHFLMRQCGVNLDKATILDVRHARIGRVQWSRRSASE